MLKTWENFLGWEISSRDTIDLKKIYIDVCGGDIIAGLLLSQIIFWFLPNRQGNMKTDLFVDGEYWITKKRTDWFYEIRVSPKQFDRALSKLVEKKVIKTMLKKFGTKPQIWIAINQNELIKAINKAQKEMIKFRPKKKIREPKETDEYVIKVNKILKEKGKDFKFEFNEFVKARAAKKRILTPYAKYLRLNEVEKLYPNNIEKQIMCIRRTIEKGWDKFYKLWEDRQNGGRRSEGF